MGKPHGHQLLSLNKTDKDLEFVIKKANKITADHGVIVGIVHDEGRKFRMLYTKGNIMPEQEYLQGAQERQEYVKARVPLDLTFLEQGRLFLDWPFRKPSINVECGHAAKAAAVTACLYL